MNTHGTEFVDAVSYTATRKIDKGNSLQRAFSVLLFTVFVVVDLRIFGQNAKHQRHARYVAGPHY